MLWNLANNLWNESNRDSSSCSSCDQQINPSKRRKCSSCSQFLCENCFKAYQKRSGEINTGNSDFLCNSCGIQMSNQNSFVGDSGDFLFEVSIIVHNYREFSRTDGSSSYGDEFTPKQSRFLYTIMCGARELFTSNVSSNSILAEPIWKKPINFFIDLRSPSCETLTIEVCSSIF